MHDTLVVWLFWEPVDLYSSQVSSDSRGRSHCGSPPVFHFPQTPHWNNQTERWNTHSSLFWNNFCLCRRNVKSVVHSCVAPKAFIHTAVDRGLQTWQNSWILRPIFQRILIIMIKYTHFHPRSVVDNCWLLFFFLNYNDNRNYQNVPDENLHDLENQSINSTFSCTALNPI